jgi:DnaJ-class molecular chaperone
MVRQDMKMDEPIEVRCDACDGTGRQPVRQPRPGHRIYPAPCKKCDGKGRIMAPDY